MYKEEHIKDKTRNHKNGKQVLEKINKGRRWVFEKKKYICKPLTSMIKTEGRLNRTHIRNETGSLQLFPCLGQCE